MESLQAAILKACNCNWSEISEFLPNSTIQPIFDLNDRALVLPISVRFWLTISRWLWWYVLIVSFVSILLDIYSGLVLLKRGWQMHHILLSIICVDALMLMTIGLSTVVEHYLRYLPYRALSSTLCKGTALASHVAAFYSNWAWLLLWLQRFMAVFYPLQQRQAPRSRGWIIGLLLVSLLVESYNAVLTTALSDSGVHYCGVRDDLIDPGIIRLLVLVEIGICYTIPLILTTAVHGIIVCRPLVVASSVTRVQRESLTNTGNAATMSGGLRRIVSRDYEQRQQKIYRQKVMVAMIVATIDLLLNLPLYALNLIDNITSMELLFPNPNHIAEQVLRAVAYVLYYLQYLLMPIYVHMLTRDRDRQPTNTH